MGLLHWRAQSVESSISNAMLAILPAHAVCRTGISANIFPRDEAAAGKPDRLLPAFPIN